MPNACKLYLLNDNSHTVGQVIIHLVKALKCNAYHAARLTREAHEKGSSIIMVGHQEECERVNSILSEINLGTRISIG
jgi:ATP-dependent Clp protease adapter protein ClpS